MIYPVDLEDGQRVYVISSQQVWLPGAYDSERTARYAFRFTDEDLRALQESINPGGVITLVMLQELRRRRVEEVSRGTHDDWAPPQPADGLDDV